MDLFEFAARKKLRWETAKGSLSDEDLWDLPLITRNGGVCLDDIAKDLHKKINDLKEESFVVKSTRQNTELEVKFEIVKHIIKAKLAEKEAKESEAARKQQKEKILQLIAEKEDEELKQKGVEDLKKMLDTL